MTYQHLDPYALALLGDHDPAPHEAAHIAECEQCARQVDIYRRQSVALRAMPDLEAPESIWTNLVARIDPVTGRRRISMAPPAPAWHRVLSIAAAFLLFFGGGAAVGVYYAQHMERAENQSVSRGPAPPAVDSVADPSLAVQTLTARVAALEALTVTAEAALRDAPGDPVIRAHYAVMRRDRDLLLERVPVVRQTARWF